MVGSGDENDFLDCPDLHTQFAELNEVPQLVIAANIRVLDGQFLRASQVGAEECFVGIARGFFIHGRGLSLVEVEVDHN